MQGHNSDLDDEIDLRGLIYSLLRYKWWIVGVALGAAIVTFLISEFAAGKNYQAKALVVFGQPVFNVNTGPLPVSNASVSLSALPDSKGITDLAVVDDMLYRVYQAPDLAQSRVHGLSFARFKQRLNASLSGTNQLLLQATDPDPAQAALVSNLWAEAVANRLNALYGSSDQQVTALEQQTTAARQAWEAAEKALLDSLPQNRVDALAAQLTQQQIAYNSQLGRVHSIDLLLSDARALNGRLSAQQPNAVLAAGDALGLLTLQQQATAVLVCNTQPVPAAQTAPNGADNPSAASDIAPLLNCSASSGLSGLQIQVSGLNTSSGPSTVADAQQQLKFFMDAVQKQQSELEGGLDQLDKQLAELHTQWESAQFQVSRLVEQRDLAKTSYETVYGQLSSTRVEVAANGQVARVAGKAIRPAAPISRVAVNTIVAGLAGLMLTAFACVIIDWWRGLLGKVSG